MVAGETSWDAAVATLDEVEACPKSADYRRSVEAALSLAAEGEPSATQTIPVIVGRDRIVEWVRAQQNPSLEFSRLAAFAEGL